MPKKIIEIISRFYTCLQWLEKFGKTKESYNYATDSNLSQIKELLSRQKDLRPHCS